MGKPWTGAEEIRLREAVESGMGRVGIIAMLGRDTDSVRRKCHSLGLRLPPRTITYNYADRVYDPTPKQIVQSSMRLRDATQALLERMAPNLRADILCPQASARPGTERIYKTSSVLRLQEAA
jgi:hypothetical protein